MSIDLIKKKSKQKDRLPLAITRGEVLSDVSLKSLSQASSQPPLATTRGEDVSAGKTSSVGETIRDLMSPERGIREVVAGQPGLHQDKLVSKSPAEKYHQSTEQMALLFNSNELSLDQLSFAKCMTQKPVYQFLENCVKNKQERETALFEIMNFLNLENISLYSSHKPQGVRPTINENLIPPLQLSLRQWIAQVQKQNYSTLSGMFLCVMQSDPLSDPAFYAHYQRMDKTDVKNVKDHLDKRVGEWNQSQDLLAEVLFIALNKTKQIQNADYQELASTIDTMWSTGGSRMIFKGSSMFWSLKEVLHAEPEKAAQAIRRKISETTMSLDSATTVDYITWVNNIYHLSDRLKEYDNYSYHDDALLELFIQQYKSALDIKHHAYDSIINKYESGALTWSILKAQKEKVSIQTIHAKRLLTAMEDDHVLLSSVNVSTGISHQVHAVSTAKQRNQSKDTKATSSTNIDKLSMVIEWSENAKCGLHCAGKTGKTHTNKECKQQIPMRRDATSISALHRALNDMRSNMLANAKKRESKQQTSSSKTESNSKRPRIHTATVPTDWRPSDNNYESTSESDNSSVDHSKRAYLYDRRSDDDESKDERNESTIIHRSITSDGPDLGYELDGDSDDTETKAENEAKMELAFIRRMNRNKARKERRAAMRQYVSEYAQRQQDPNRANVWLYRG